MLNRREFIKILLAGGAVAGLGNLPFNADAKTSKRELTKITLLHTNDTHSHIDPFPVQDPKFPGMGGFARRAAIIKEIRKEEKNVLLFDAGDVFQGSPYFNYYNGEVEFKLMSEMRYDAVTIGNHEFDNGLENFAQQMQYANFPFICSNYDFSDTPLNGKTIPYKIIEIEGVKIGVFGLGIELQGLVLEWAYGNTKYIDPTVKAAEMSYLLKKKNNCDLVICLSHLGFSYQDRTISDIALAKQSKNIDVIIGGHTHTFLDKPVIFRNSDGKEVIIAQVGWGGVKLGRIDFYLQEKNKLKIASANTINIFDNQV
jgi:5'-nucleotidase